jgi:hypothetical protein
MAHAKWEAGGSPPRRKDRPRCRARTRAGGACLVRVEPGKARCRFHGGLSTGPRKAAPGSRRRSSIGGAPTVLAKQTDFATSSTPGATRSSMHSAGTVDP